jgi:hypothetical protein
MSLSQANAGAVGWVLVNAVALGLTLSPIAIAKDPPTRRVVSWDYDVMTE